MMGACYFLTIGGMAWNLIRIKLQGDLEEDMKEYREYDLSHEKIKLGASESDQKYIVLANHKANSEENKTPLFEYTEPSYAPYDPTRYLENHKIRKEFSLTIKEEC